MSVASVSRESHRAGPSSEQRIENMTVRFGALCPLNDEVNKAVREKTGSPDPRRVQRYPQQQKSIVVLVFPEHVMAMLVVKGVFTGWVEVTSTPNIPKNEYILIFLS